MDAAEVPLPAPVGEVLLRLMSCPDLASKARICQQYDNTVMGDTVAGSGGDAAVLRAHCTCKALSTTPDCTPRSVAPDPVPGGPHAGAGAGLNAHTLRTQ